ncbi:hypothetical protein [Bradyrhizobium manausense]|uniref:hypothetical protein n=1 Tax=Bradyrhizobium manausense TaxID=989370 RepID=UPI001BA9A6F5|nr:hypothetical protein [Bradyrhizobium manausense]MBR0722528.1 hypothetical protein [Bradyrhizobium manausense]
MSDIQKLVGWRLSERQKDNAGARIKGSIFIPSPRNYRLVVLRLRWQGEADERKEESDGLSKTIEIHFSLHA